MKQRFPTPVFGLALAVALGLGLALAMTGAPAAQAQQNDPGDARAFFRDNCARCHTIGGGRLTGPDLKDVHQRQSLEWLLGFMQDPQALIDSGDPYARQLFESARGVVMPQVAGLDAQRAQSLLDMITAESALESSEFSTPQVPPDPFTDSDRVIGQLIFTGKAPLSSGAPPCSSCHDLAGLPGWGGGQTALDLSRMWEHLGGRAAVAAWLQAPSAQSAAALSAVAHRPMETSEVLPLSATLEAAARSGRTDPARSQLSFSATAWGIAALVLMLTSWFAGRKRADGEAAGDAAGDNTAGSAPWAIPSLLLGLAVVAVLHLLPLAVPGAVLDLTRQPRTLWVLETAHLAAGLLALCGLFGLRLSGLRRTHRRRTRPPWKLRDTAMVIALGIAVATGVLSAIVHRWGLPWLAGWLMPELAALLGGETSGGSLLGALPFLIQLHLGAGLAALVLLPFSRWRGLLDPRRLDPRKIRWRSPRSRKETTA